MDKNDFQKTLLIFTFSQYQQSGRDGVEGCVNVRFAEWMTDFIKWKKIITCNHCSRWQCCAAVLTGYLACISHEKEINEPHFIAVSATVEDAKNGGRDLADNSCTHAKPFKRQSLHNGQLQCRIISYFKMFFAAFIVLLDVLWRRATRDIIKKKELKN